MKYGKLYKLKKFGRQLESKQWNTVCWKNQFQVCCKVQSKTSLQVKNAATNVHFEGSSSKLAKQLKLKLTNSIPEIEYPEEIFQDNEQLRNYRDQQLFLSIVYNQGYMDDFSGIILNLLAAIYSLDSDPYIKTESLTELLRDSFKDVQDPFHFNKLWSQCKRIDELNSVEAQDFLGVLICYVYLRSDGDLNAACRFFWKKEIDLQKFCEKEGKEVWTISKDVKQRFPLLYHYGKCLESQHNYIDSGTVLCLLSKFVQNHCNYTRLILLGDAVLCLHFYQTLLLHDELDESYYDTISDGSLDTLATSMNIDQLIRSFVGEQAWEDVKLSDVVRMLVGAMFLVTGNGERSCEWMQATDTEFIPVVPSCDGNLGIVDLLEESNNAFLNVFSSLCEQSQLNGNRELQTRVIAEDLDEYVTQVSTDDREISRDSVREMMQQHFMNFKNIHDVVDMGEDIILVEDENEEELSSIFHCKSECQSERVGYGQQQGYGQGQDASKVSDRSPQEVASKQQLSESNLDYSDYQTTQSKQYYFNMIDDITRFSDNSRLITYCQYLRNQDEIFCNHIPSDSDDHSYMSIRLNLLNMARDFDLDMLKRLIILLLSQGNESICQKVCENFEIAKGNWTSYRCAIVGFIKGKEPEMLVKKTTQESKPSQKSKKKKIINLFQDLIRYSTEEKLELYCRRLSASQRYRQLISTSLSEETYIVQRDTFLAISKKINQEELRQLTIHLFSNSDKFTCHQFCKKFTLEGNGTYKDTIIQFVKRNY
eukprot:TRINITY_DN3476_c1_g2_i1.p1 TRINITY_DN3476_c1_g2~~TRINITY_DN3476_c1_g2_i1.p1  ORF type:complete len:764 (+),score=51.50 TRINITY_DN3476_c1_g2_i1:174-2465(+)